MSTKFHFVISVFKSIVRIVFCLAAWITGNINFLCLGFVAAEVLGIFEELGETQNEPLDIAWTKDGCVVGLDCEMYEPVTSGYPKNPNDVDSGEWEQLTIYDEKK